MKKNLLIGLFALAAIVVNAQVVFLIPEPSEVAGNYTSTFEGQPGNPNGWGSPDMTDPANAVIGELAMAIDGSEADSLLCDAAGGVINDIAGKIAVYYRGACEFGSKALMAQNAGAIAAVIINNSGEPVGMGGGVDGPVVTIPVFMISTADGATLRPAIEAGGLEVWLFNKFGFFNHDLGITPNGVLRAEHFAHPTVLADEPGEYVVQMGADIINYGSETQSNVSLSAVVTLNESVLYNETSGTVLAMANGDTVTFDLPPFTMDEFSKGMYKVNYAVVFSEVDEFPGDNVIPANFMISDSLFSYGRIVEETGQPLVATGVRYIDGTESVHVCIHFQDPNASSMSVQGLTFSGSMDEGELVGVTVDVYAYEWPNEFEDVLDPNYAMDALDELAFGSFEYTSEDQDEENIYVPFDNGSITLQDDVRYLFCFNEFENEYRWGSDNEKTDYNKNLDFYLQPLFPTERNESWLNTDGFPNITIFGTDNAPAIAVNMKDVLTSINEEAVRVEITPFPNPTANRINIPVGNNYGKTLIDVYDIAGKKVKSLNVTTTNFEIIKVDVSDLDNGAYIFKMNFENGSFSNFNVVVNN